jgi:hypothetical protein
MNSAGVVLANVTDEREWLAGGTLEKSGPTINDSGVEGY